MSSAYKAAALTSSQSIRGNENCGEGSSIVWYSITSDHLNVVKIMYPVFVIVVHISNI